MDSIEKKRIKIKFVDFWGHWNENDNFIVNLEFPTLFGNYI